MTGLPITLALTDPDGDWAGNLRVEARTYGKAQAVSFGLGTEFGSAHVVTTTANLAALYSALGGVVAGYRLTDDDKFSIEDAMCVARHARPGATRAELVDDLRRTRWEPSFGAAVADAAAAWVLR